MAVEHNRGYLLPRQTTIDVVDWTTPVLEPWQLQHEVAAMAVWLQQHRVKMFATYTLLED